MASVAADARQRIAKVVLAEAGRIRLSPRLEHERRVALFDLVDDNTFALKNGAPGPYNVHLGIETDRLLFTVCDESERTLAQFTLPLMAFRRIVKDYFLICDSYHQAIRTASPSRIEAIDMGRRGLHDEGAELLREKLAVCIDMDLTTARRLFTLICVLHIRP